MDVLTQILPIVIDVLLIVLLTVGIILIIKCIYIVDKAKSVMLNVEEKVNSLNSFFNIINFVNNKVALLSEKFYGIVEALMTKFNGHEEDEELIEKIEKQERKKRK